MLEHRDLFAQAQLDRLCQRFVGHQRHFVLRKSWQRTLGKSFGEVYDLFRSRAQVNGLEEGPLSIYRRGHGPLLVRWVAAGPKQISWATACKHYDATSDHAYVFWHMCTLLPHFHDRIRAQGTMRTYLHALRLPPPVPL
eukprot:3727280-Pyramimonas_sp.AAC.1